MHLCHALSCVSLGVNRVAEGRVKVGSARFLLNPNLNWVELTANLRTQTRTSVDPRVGSTWVRFKGRPGSTLNLSCQLSSSLKNTFQRKINSPCHNFQAGRSESKSQWSRITYVTISLRLLCSPFRVRAHGSRVGVGEDDKEQLMSCSSLKIQPFETFIRCCEVIQAVKSAFTHLRGVKLLT